MRKWLLGAAVFVVLLFTFYTPSAAYDEQVGTQLSWFSSFSSAVSSFASSVSSAVSSAVSAVSSAISSAVSAVSSAFSGGTSSSSSSGGSGTTSSGSGSGGGTSSSGGKSGSGSGSGSGSSSGSGTTGSSSGSSSSISVSAISGSFGSGGVGRIGGSGYSDLHSLNPLREAWNFITAPFSGPVFKVEKAPITFNSQTTPFNQNTGTQAATSNILLNTMLGASGMGVAYTLFKASNSPNTPKIIKGWQYAAEGLWDGICKFTGSVANQVGIGFDYVNNHPVEAAALIGGGLLNGAVYVASGRAALDAGKFLYNGAIAYGNALQKDPIDTLAKTAIVVGGLVAAIPSGGSSLLVAGAAIGAIGAGAIIANDSWQFTQTQSDAELKQVGNSKGGDIIWVAGAALTGIQALKIANVAKVTPVAKTTEEIKDLTLRVWGTERAPPAFATGNPLVTGDPTRSIVMVVQNIDDPTFMAYKNTIMAHETFGETAYLRGVVKVPQWVDANPLLHDVAIDSAVSRFIGKGPLEAAQHTWWTNPQAWGLTSTQVSNIQKATQIPSWYRGSWGPYVSGGLTAGSAVSGNATNTTVR